MTSPLLTTAEITPDPALGALVDALAAAPFEASHVGYAGTPSRAWVAFQALREAASTEVLLALLQHRSFVVRAYVAEHAARHHPEHARALAGLVRDTAQVWQRAGCLPVPTSMSEEILGAIEPHAGHPEVQALLQEVASDVSSGAAGVACRLLLARSRPEAR